MRYNLSPIRHAFELLLTLVGRGPRRSGFTPARDPKSRMRFAQYVSKVQPAPDPTAMRQAARLLGQGGALSNGVVRHAPLSGVPTSGLRRATLHLISQPEDVVARRRAQAFSNSTSLRTLLDALRVR
jgi:hypothetical protein